ncbi:MAG: DUF3127 domain-containing protein [Dysgonamonadaceae bacterium]|jgi:hypothetical protein|nr:DUF3127 domain-containing protein [Dysgonamonadaceae bacterium]
MEIKGKIINVQPLQTGEGRNGMWKKQDYVLEYNLDSQYPKKMMFNLWGDKIDQFAIKEGQDVKVDFDIDCREYNGRWYNDIRAWRVEAAVLVQQGNNFAPDDMPPPPPPTFDSSEFGGESNSDLPF